MCPAEVVRKQQRVGWSFVFFWSNTRSDGAIHCSLGACIAAVVAQDRFPPRDCFRGCAVGTDVFKHVLKGGGRGL